MSSKFKIAKWFIHIETSELAKCGFNSSLVGAQRLCNYQL